MSSLFAKCWFIQHPVFIISATIYMDFRFLVIIFIPTFSLIVFCSVLFLFLCFSHVSGFPQVYAHTWCVFIFKTLKSWHFCVYGQDLSTGDGSGGPSIHVSTPLSAQVVFSWVRVVVGVGRKHFAEIRILPGAL